MMENIEIKIKSVNISDTEGRKFAVEQIRVESNGIVNDYRSGKFSSKICILDVRNLNPESQENNGEKSDYGLLGEHLSYESQQTITPRIFDYIFGEEVVLEVIQESEHHQELEKTTTKKPVYCRVIQSGIIRQNEIMHFDPKTFTIKIITLSDRAFSGEYEDRSGPKIKNMVINYFNQIQRLFQIETEIIPDDATTLETLIEATVAQKFDIIITTGGTGIGPKDITIETLRPMLKKEIPGIMEFVRMKYGAENPNALLSLSLAGVIDQTLVYALPGSVKAVNEYMNEILKTLIHLLYMLHGIDVH
jgi:molybdenum cofactor synthesis domain-containing protein